MLLSILPSSLSNSENHFEDNKNAENVKQEKVVEVQQWWLEFKRGIKSDKRCMYLVTLDRTRSPHRRKLRVAGNDISTQTRKTLQLKKHMIMLDFIGFVAMGPHSLLPIHISAYQL
ncbi:hypothetical protein ES319_1Z212900v1 [Gossypium barbadense]|uniref:Uncharacterized protein n=1 Tax=Gossypium barbadense TaxID=3634 RepID=A0A5J5NAS2_GOSBA|nr:hypothetical protein ES319_1Z212900v1 [Gossypium barbadense]